MVGNKLTILIPTRNRSETLYWSIKSCLNQDYENLEVIVSDNFSSDDTASIVRSFTDKRLSYYNTGKTLSMSHNWEFALSKVDAGFVSILGDDDAFLPGSVAEINRILDRHQVDAITWKQSFYRWPTNKFARINNILAVPRRKRMYVRDGKNTLEALLGYRLMVDEVPWLYGGFVKYDLIDRVKKKGNGIFFNSRIPDIYSAVVLSSLAQRYLYSSRPFSIAGHSGKSNGSAQMKPAIDSSVTRLFNTEADNIKFHRKVEFIHTHAFLLWESFLQAEDAGVISDDKKTLLDPWKLLETGIKECGRLGMLNAEQEKILLVAKKNEFDIERVKLICSKYDRRNSATMKKIVSSLRFWTENVIVDESATELSNVYDASLAQEKIHNSSNFFYLFNNIRTLITKLNQMKRRNE